MTATTRNKYEPINFLNIPALPDAEYIASLLTLPELRVEYRVSHVNTHPDADDYGFWLWYGLVVSEAIDLIRFQQPVKLVATNSKGKRIDLEAVRAHADIITLAEGYGLQLQKSGRNFKALCPFHTEKMPSFTLYPDSNRFHCFGCQADGDAISFVMKMDGVDFKSAAEKVGG